MKVLLSAIVLLIAVHGWGESLESLEMASYAPSCVLTGLETAPSMERITFPKDLARDCVARIKWREGRSHRRCTPPPPHLPRNFRFTGRYIVPDLVDPATGQVGITVPFTWHGKDGNSQMIAGSEEDPIFFTNLIFDGHLYTYTYKWPCLQPEFLPPLEPCHPLFEFTLEDLNAFFASAQYVGAEILEEKPRRHVHHFRVAVALPRFPPGFYPRLPILSADIYVDQKDSSKFWKVLHFGLQNIYDPNLDEWIIIDKVEFCPGEVELPAACTPPGCGPQ